MITPVAPLSRLVRLGRVGWWSLVAAPLAVFAADTKTLTVDFAQPTGALSPDLWSSCGLDQGRMTPAFDQDMQHVGSVPYEGGRWMRPHDLLYLVKATDLETTHPNYDWTDLDKTFDTILAAGLKPVFELMGNPSKHFTSFLDKAQLEQWKSLVTALAVHLEQRYGAPEIRSWLFESWNEPDINGGWKWTVPAEHHNYYDACSEGLKAADPALRFGGPGLSRQTMPYGEFLQAFLNHCDTGTNYFTGEKGVRLDFISVHRKNKPKEMVDVEVTNINDILRDHPRFASLPIFNGEADSEVGWSKSYDYRATPWYAAFVARSVNEHLVRIVDGGSITGGRKLVDYRMANDDAFWGVWTTRSQMAQFGTNEQFAFIKKPSHTVRTALALLGNVRCAVTGFELADNIGAVATRRGANQVAVLVYNYSDETTATGVSPVRLNLEHLPFAAGKWAHYRIDAEHGDTQRAWQAMGSPAKPTDEQIQALRSGQELGVCEPIADVAGPSLSRTFDLPLPGVSLILITADPGPSAAPLKGLYAQRYPSLNGAHEDVMLKWTSGPRSVKTYEVLRASARSGPFERINPADQIETGFVFQRAPGEHGFVKVRAIDLWGRPAGETEVIEP